jgi:hypothetical protein
MPGPAPTGLQHPPLFKTLARVEETSTGTAGIIIAVTGIGQTINWGVKMAAFTPGVGFYIELGMVLGSSITVFVGCAAYWIGHQTGTRVTAAAQALETATAMRIEAEQRFRDAIHAGINSPTVQLPLVTSTVGDTPTVVRPRPH